MAVAKPVETPRESKTTTSSSRSRRLFQSREFGVFVALVVLSILMGFLSPYFLKPENIFNVLRGMSTIGIMAIGQTMIIVTGGIDLSVGSMLAASAMFAARLVFTASCRPGSPSWRGWASARCSASQTAWSSPACGSARSSPRWAC